MSAWDIISNVYDDQIHAADRAAGARKKLPKEAMADQKLDWRTFWRCPRTMMSRNFRMAVELLRQTIASEAKRASARSFFTGKSGKCPGLPSRF